MFVHINPRGSSAKKHGQVEGPSVPPASGSGSGPARESAVPFLDRCIIGKGKQCQERFLQCIFEANSNFQNSIYRPG